MVTPAITWISGVLVNIGLATFIFLLLRSFAVFPVYKSRLFKILSFLPWGLMFLLVVYQAKWQLFGFLSPDFLRVQRGFDSRGDLVGGRFNRGKILDRTGEPLAFDDAEDSFIVRRYPLGPAGAHVVGYHHPLFGSTGMEKAFDAVLMGRKIRNPADFLRLVANGFVHRTLRGNPVGTTLDARLQITAYQLLRNHVGAITVIDPRTGAVLAMASSPTFHPEKLERNSFEKLAARDDCPFLNRSLQGRYAPGSTFKILMAVGALENNLDLTVSCGPEGFYCGKNEPVLHDYEHEVFAEQGRHFAGHGEMDFDRAFALSCNVYFAHLGEKLGVDSILEIAHRAGFEEQIDPAGLGLSSASGRVPDVSNPYLARTVRLAIGQDQLLSTPIHLALIAGAVGSDGRRVKPRYLSTSKPEFLDELTTERYATDVARKMINVVENGTGKAARIPGIIVGGKTGTVENESGKSHAIFIGFAPWPVPAVCFSIVLEQAGAGGVEAAPLAAELLKKVDEINYFEEDISAGNKLK